ncbi:MAG: TRAM domain-containing protein [Candidatus Nomurabacteria bacterium]|nr:TRAM domain-containing protein [Candidatus Nomurabacteria bacterium]
MKKSWPDQMVKLDKFVPGGQAIGDLPDGRKVFVWGALPGEAARVHLTRSKKSYAEGIATEILQPSPQRIAPRDDCYLSTSPWQILDWNFELAQKTALVREAFAQAKIELDLNNVKRSGQNQTAIQPILTDGRQFGYRGKMDYALYWDNDLDKIRLALHRRGSHQKIPIEQSSIERPEIFAAAQNIVAELNRKNQPARRYQSLLIRASQNGEVRAALIENGRPHPNLPPLHDRVLGRDFAYSPLGFFQINLPVYEMALTEISKFIKSKKVVDLYAGVGTIGLSVAADRDLVLVESDPRAFDELSQNAKPFSSARAILAKSENALEFITPDAGIIVDPPRAGLDRKVVEKLNTARPPRVIYLSCNPTTQARDVAGMLENYRIILCQPLNFFPRTPHIENLIVLEKR